MPERVRILGERGAHFIKAWRKAKGHTITTLAQAIGTSAANVSRIENGKQAYTQDTLEGIASALGVSAAELVGGPPDTESQDDAAADDRDEQFLANLRQAMVAKGHTMRSLSDAAGLGPTTVRDILERGRSPSVRTLRPLAAVLGVPIAQLMGETPSENLSVAQVNAHTVLIRRAAIEAAERIVAQAGPINSAPRDIVKQIVVDVFGFCMEGAPNEG